MNNERRGEWRTIRKLIDRVKVEELVEGHGHVQVEGIVARVGLSVDGIDLCVDIDLGKS